MTTATRLFQKYTQAELLEQQERICADPANRNPPGTSLFIHTPKARKKLDAIREAIAAHQAQKRAAAGNPVPTCGYSGRQTNRR